MGYIRLYGVDGIDYSFFFPHAEALMAYSNGLFAQAGVPNSDLTLASVGTLFQTYTVWMLGPPYPDPWADLESRFP